MNRKRFLFVLIALVILGIVLLPRAWATISPQQPDRYSMHVVRAKETLWDISKRYMPQVDPRAGVRWIRLTNGISDRDTIQPGDVLNIPDDDGEMAEPLAPTYSTAKAAQAANRAAEREAREGQQSASRGGQREMVMEATAYTSYDAGMDGKGITFSGLPADRGVVATDPAVIEIGSVVWVEGYGYAVALDRGGAIKGNRIDVYFHDKSLALEWGRRQVRVRVIR